MSVRSIPTRWNSKLARTRKDCMISLSCGKVYERRGWIPDPETMTALNYQHMDVIKSSSPPVIWTSATGWLKELQHVKSVLILRGKCTRPWPSFWMNSAKESWDHGPEGAPNAVRRCPTKWRRHNSNTLLSWITTRPKANSGCFTTVNGKARY